MVQSRWIIPSLVVFTLGLSSCGTQPTQVSNTDFGGQPKDQEARERHHPQYPDSAQHLGPQPDQPTTSESAQKTSEQQEQERAAVSGVGR
jgi:hypothetical protein